MLKLSKYEKARLIGMRAVQIANGAELTIPPDGITDPIELAEMELKRGTIPLIVVRRLPNGEEVRIKLKRRV